MGWFSGGSSPVSIPDDRPVGKDGYKAPDRHERTACWAARDSFFACLDSANIVDSVRGEGATRAATVCAAQLKDFEGACAASWVTYFKKRRIMEAQREATIRRLQAEGADVALPPVAKGNAGK